MRKIVSLLIAASFVIAASTASMAGPRGINSRQHREQQRINQGIRSGELTRREAMRLEAAQARIRTYERFARSDGNLTARERAHIQRGLSHESRSIYRQKHDRQDRNP
jgi:hypothetical protein